GVFQERLERRQHLRFVQQRSAFRAAHREVIGFAFLPAERQPDQLRLQRVEASRLQVDGEALLFAEVLAELLELRRRVDQVVRRLPIRSRGRPGCGLTVGGIDISTEWECLLFGKKRTLNWGNRSRAGCGYEVAGQLLDLLAETAEPPPLKQG